MPEKTVNKNLLNDRNLYMVFIVTLFAVMGVASIAPAFPKMISFFLISEKEVGWMIASFTLPGVFLAPFMGFLADRLGRKNILVPSLILFGIAGFSCLFAGDFTILLVFRFIQGIAAAALGSLSITLIGDLYHGNSRMEAMGYNASVLSLGTASYPLIGGILATAGWQFPFILPVFAIPLGLVVAIYLKNPEPKQTQSVGNYLKNSLKNLGRTRVIIIYILEILVFFLLYGASLTYFPLLLGERLKAESWQIGLIISLMSFVTAFFSSQIGRCNKILGSSRILPVAISMYGLSMLLIIFSGNWLMIIVPVILFGIGHGLFIPTIQTMLVSLAPLNERAGFMSINLMVLRFGQTLGPVLLGISYTLGKLPAVFLSGTAIAIIMMLTVLIFLKKNEKYESSSS